MSGYFFVDHKSWLEITRERGRLPTSPNSFGGRLVGWASPSRHEAVAAQRLLEKATDLRYIQPLCSGSDPCADLEI